MKKSILIWMLLLPSLLMGQQMNFRTLYDKYTGKEGFTTIDLSMELLRTLGRVADEDVEWSDLLKNIQSIRIVMASSKSEEFVTDMERIIEDTDYTLLTSINESGQKTKFFCSVLPENEKKSKSSNRDKEFLMLSYGNNDNLVMQIVGDVDVSQISKLSGKMTGK